MLVPRFEKDRRVCKATNTASGKILSLSELKKRIEMFELILRGLGLQARKRKQQNTFLN